MRITELKKIIREEVENALGKKYRSIDDFIRFYSHQINSTFDKWMETSQIESLYKLYNLGGDIISKTFEYDYESDAPSQRIQDAWIKKMKAAGYQYFDSSRKLEVDNGVLEIIMIKILKK